MEDIEVIKAKAEIEAQKAESQTPAKEVASKYIGKSAVPWIVLLVIVGVVSAAFMPPESLPAVIGLVSTAVMALISMLSGITGTKEKEEKPEISIITDLVARLDKKEPLVVEIKGDKVVVTKGDNTISSAKNQDS